MRIFITTSTYINVEITKEIMMLMHRIHYIIYMYLILAIVNFSCETNL